MDDESHTLHALRQHQAAIADFGGFALRQSDHLKVMKEAARVCAESLGVPFCKVCQYRPAENDLLVIAGWGWRAGVVGHVVSRADDSSPQGRAFISGEPSICGDLRTDNTFSPPAFYAEHGIVSIVDVVIKGGDRPYGILEVDSDARQVFDKDDIDFLTAFANILGEAVATSARTASREAVVEHLARSEERFRIVVDATPGALVMFNANGRIEMANGQAERTFGYSEADLLGQKMDMLVPERFQASYPALVPDLFRESSRKATTDQALLALHKDGHEFQVEIGLSSIGINGDTMTLSSISDISERILLEAELRQAHLEGLFRQAVEAAPNAMVMTDVDARIEMVNAQAERMFGYARQEMLGHTIEMLVPERFRRHHPALRTVFVSDPRPRPMGAGRDLYALRKDGSEFPVEIGLNPMETKDGTKVLSAIVDISDRKQKEDRVRSALNEKEILLREIHHRVKNNLQIVHSLLDLQSAQISDKLARDMLRVSQSRIRSMALIHQTLYTSNDFAKVDFGRFLDSLVPVLIDSYVVDSSRISVRIDVDPVQLPIDSAVPCGLIVNELITNALKHAFGVRDHGEIRVALTCLANNETMLSVSDDGIGFPDRIDMSSTDTLGLQLVHLLADQLGGTVTIHRSGPTRITLQFPSEP